jgi:hypothetical protein
MNIFIQGLRRSGTTILFDLLSADPQWDAYYEPLALGRPAVGGGSGAQTVDLFADLRQRRELFLAANPHVAPDLLNYGAPTRPELEFETELPADVLAYLRFLLDGAPDTVLKFTRMYCKVPVLLKLDPEAFFVQVVRSPLAITASYLFGKGQQHYARLERPSKFFRAPGWRKPSELPWKATAFTDQLLSRPEFAHLKGCSDVTRLLLLWKFTFAETYRAGRECFGSRYRLLRHEDLANDYAGTLTGLYDDLGRELPASVHSWASEHVRPPGPMFHPLDKRWRAAAERVDLAQELKQAGYQL